MSIIRQRPYPNSYVVPGSNVIAGEYPFAPYHCEGLEKIRAILDAGATAFIDLTEPGEKTQFGPLRPYAQALAEEAASRGIRATFQRLSIPDMGVAKPSRMAEVLDAISEAEREGRGVYVHCWGGVGRTGTVVGCYLRERGATGEEALEEVGFLFGTMAKAIKGRHPEGSPQTERQRRFVRSWERPMLGTPPHSATVEVDA